MTSTPGEPSSPKLQPGPRERVGEAVKSASQPPEQGLGPQQPPLSRETKAPAAAPTRIEVTIPIPLDMYQGSGAPEGSGELWDQGGTEGLARAGGTGGHKDGPSPLRARAPIKEDSGGRERDEDRDIDEISGQGLPSLVDQCVSLAPEKGSCPAAAQETREEYDGENKSKGVLRDTPGEALLVEAESHKAGEDQEKQELLEGEGGPDSTLSEPSGSVSQKEAEPREGEDSGPVLETAKLPAEGEDGVKKVDEDAPVGEAVPDAGGRRTPRRKPGGLAADKASRVPLLKGVCSSTAACCHLGSCCLEMAWTCAVTDAQLLLPPCLPIQSWTGLTEPCAAVLRPLHGAGVSLIMLFSPVFVLISLDLLGGCLNPHLVLSLRRRGPGGGSGTLAWAHLRVQLVPAGHVSSGLHGQ